MYYNTYKTFLPTSMTLCDIRPLSFYAIDLLVRWFVSKITPNVTSGFG